MTLSYDWRPVDNAKHHHAKLVQEWLNQPACRIKLHFMRAARRWLNHLGPVIAAA